MWLDNEYLQIYLIGCLVSFFFSVIGVVLLSAVDWFTKGYVLRKNLKKILSPDDNSFILKMGMYFIGYLITAIFSWVGVAMTLWLTGTRLLTTIREVFSSTPEEIKILRFPLYNNSNLSKEAVWAYGIALNLKTGGTWDEYSLRNELNEIYDNYPTFNRHSAITLLEELKVIDTDYTKSLKEEVDISILMKN